MHRFKIIAATQTVEIFRYCLLRNLDAKKFQFFLTQKSPKSIENAFMRLRGKDQIWTSEESFLLFYAELVEVRVGEMKLSGG